MALHLKDAINPADAAHRLRSCASEARNLPGSSAGQQLEIHVNNYLSWVNMAEAQLRNLFVDSDIWRSLRGDTFWKIRGLTQASPRGIELINDEANTQADRLEALASRLSRFAERLEVAKGALVVVDTHVLLHFQPPSEVDWNTLVEDRSVRLVLPLRVVEELDEKKYTARDDVADRARRLLSQLRTQLAPSAGWPVSMRSGVTIEVPVDDEPRVRSLDADQEILDLCRELRSTGRRVVLVTGDAGMELRAAAQGTEVVPMDERYLRKKTEPSR